MCVTGKTWDGSTCVGKIKALFTLTFKMTVFVGSNFDHFSIVYNENNGTAFNLFFSDATKTVTLTVSVNET